MGRKLITAPTDEPINLAEIKNFLRIDGDDDEWLLLDLIRGARTVFETETGRQLITATWEYYLDNFEDEIELPLPPLQTITLIKYYDEDGVEQTVSSDDYEADVTVEPGIIRLKWWDDATWPTIQTRPNCITIKYTAGYGTRSDVPERAKEAMRLLIGHWYENREDVIVGNYARQLPRGFNSLVNGLKVPYFP